MNFINYIIGCIFAVFSFAGGFPVDASWVDLLVGSIAIYMPLVLICAILAIIAIHKKRVKAKKIKNGEITPTKDYIIK